MKTAFSSAMHSCRCVDSILAYTSRPLAAAVAALVMLASSGCVVVPVPLPGIKSGRGVDESTAQTISAGTSMQDVILRFGEPDSVSIDGRIFAYRFSRTWGAVLWAIGGAGAAQGGALPVQYGEAIVIEFDDAARVALAERRAGNWMDPRPDEEPLFYRSEYLDRLRLGDESVVTHHRVLWWRGPRPSEPADARRPIGLPPWIAGVTGSLRLTDPGSLFFTPTALWLRRAFSTGTAATDTIRIPHDSIAAIVPFDRGTQYELTLVLTRDGRVLALQEPPTSGNREGLSITNAIAAHCPVISSADDADQPLEGWVVWVSTKAEKGKPRGPLHFSCLWLTRSGLRFENFDIAGKPAGTEFLAWAAIEKINPGSRKRTIIGVQIASADVVCRDGRTLCVTQSAPVTERAHLHQTLGETFARVSP